MIAPIRSGLFALALLVAASPAAAQWSPVPGVPASNVFSVTIVGDTITAGMDTCVVLSTDGGSTLTRSARLPGVAVVEAALVYRHRLYAGSFGQGVFVSDNLGATWQAYNQGLTGGIANSQLAVVDLVVLGDHIYAATAGAGVYVRNVNAGGWSHVGNVLEPAQASNVNSLVTDGTRLEALAGANGEVFYLDPGDADWTESFLNNVGLRPSLTTDTGVWNGSAWVLGTNAGFFHGTSGAEPWTPFNPGFGSENWNAVTARGRRIFSAIDLATGAAIVTSGDDGASWDFLEFQPSVFVFKMATHGNDLYAARGDGLWLRTTEDVSVEPVVGSARGLRFALTGAQPVRDVARFRFELPQAGVVRLDVFDVTGRRVGESVDRVMPAGSGDLSWDARGLAPGVYAARLTAGGSSKAVRVVRVN